MKFDIQEINKKNKLIDDVIIKLKNEFVGIDEQIDMIMNNVRTWYLYPEFQTRPVVISIYGLTGTGKSDLVKKIAKYMNLEKDLVYFNFAEINDMQAYEVESNIEEQLSNEKSNRMFVFDEFQYAATLDEHGAEKDNRSGMKPFWELMDSGILHRRNSYRSTRSLFKIISALMKINQRTPIIIEKGEWVNINECLKDIDNYTISHYKELFEIYYNENTKRFSCFEEINDDRTVYEYDEITGKGYQRLERDLRFFIKSYYIEQVYRVQNNIDASLNEIDFYQSLFKMNFEEILDLLFKTYDKLLTGYDLNFSDSLIFVIANLDEAYQVSFNVNPDMSPDQFHKITKNINIVDIKSALRKRFRNEQIARLGNIHIIYPAFSSQTFKDIINLNLNEYATKVKENFDFTLRFHNSIKKCIYDEAVYPTHGTRPVFSTIHEIIKSKMPHIIRHIHDNNLLEKVKYIEYKFKNKKTIINVYDENDNFLSTTSFKEKLRLDKLRETVKDEKQALCAVHESGHFVVYAALTGKLPEKIISRSAESEIGGFMMPDYDNDNRKMFSFKNIITDLQVGFGGYVAEKLIFGEEHLTSGACSDLEKVTTLASKAIRNWCMGKHPYMTTYLVSHPNPNLSGHLIRNEEETQEEIVRLIEDVYHKTEEILNKPEWRNMLKESSQYLLEHSSMPANVMKELYDKIPDNLKVKPNENYYRDQIANI